MIKSIRIEGFKSIRHLTPDLEKFELHPLNVIVGANGAGKSNFIQVFSMLLAMLHGNLQSFLEKNGGADAFPYDGWETTRFFGAWFEFTSRAGDGNQYRFWLHPTADGRAQIEEERRYKENHWQPYGPPSLESNLEKYKDEKSSFYPNVPGVGYYVYEAISNWMIYHFHDSSTTGPMRREEITDDSEILRMDGRNLAPFLLNLRKNFPSNYRSILNAIHLILPFFEDFRLDVFHRGEAEKVKLNWKQKNSSYPMQPYHLSDGAIRFICLATALLQPKLPSTLIIDEPELGLHPEAIQLLAELIKAAATQTQVIVATQSPLLLDQFKLEDIIVARRENGSSTFARLNENDYKAWLEDYTIGELWTKNVIDGGTAYE